MRTFHCRFAIMISNLSEFDFNLVIATGRHIIHMFNLTKKRLKIAAATVQVVIDKLVYARAAKC
jgi:hypothetical protein